MDDTLTTNKVKEESKIDCKIFLTWVERYSPGNIIEAKERLQEVNISYLDTSFYDPTSNTIYVSENSNQHNLNHELVHLISHKNRNLEDERVGINNTVCGLTSNEALTELATLLVLKGSGYLRNTPFAQLIIDYRNTSTVQPGYLYATEYFIKRVKERNLDETKINHLVSTYLFKEGTAKSVIEDIQTILRINNLEEGVRNYQKEKGYELILNIWENFKEEEKTKEWGNMMIELNNQKITLKQLFQPFEISLINHNLKPFCSINRDKKNLYTQIGKIAKTENPLSFDMTLLYMLMSEGEKLESKQSIKEYIIRKAMNLYNTVYKISN